METANGALAGMTWRRTSDDYEIGIVIVYDYTLRLATATIRSGDYTYPLSFGVVDRYSEPAAMVVHTQMALERCHQRVTLHWSRRGSIPKASELIEMLKYEIWAMVA